MEIGTSHAAPSHKSEWSQKQPRGQDTRLKSPTKRSGIQRCRNRPSHKTKHRGLLKT